MSMWVKQKGFTIVELLIVIVVIAVLAAITIVAYNGIQQRAQLAKAESDINTITKAIMSARVNTDKTLTEITGSSGTAYECTHQEGSNTTDENQDLSKLDPSHLCWVRYSTAMNALSVASGMDIRNIKDPWGRPYLIDENEGVDNGCTRDTVAMFTQPYEQGFVTHSKTSEFNIALSGLSGC